MIGKRDQARRDRAPLPGWVWLLAGVVLGVALGGLAIWRDLARETPPAPRPGEGTPSAAAPAEPRPRYDFYTILPEQEAVVPNEELERAARGEPAAGEGSASGAITLQVGSFRDPRDAEALKARIALLGEVARVVPVVIDGHAWYRVRLGPFPDPRALDEVRRRLAAHGIEGIALRESAP